MLGDGVVGSDRGVLTDRISVRLRKTAILNGIAASDVTRASRLSSLS